MQLESGLMILSGTFLLRSLKISANGLVIHDDVDDLSNGTTQFEFGTASAAVVIPLFLFFFRNKQESEIEFVNNNDDTDFNGTPSTTEAAEGFDRKVAVFCKSMI